MISTRVYSFEAYGLNKYRNFLQSDYLVGYNQNSICDFCVNALNGCECDNAAVFIHALDGEMYVMTWNYEEEYYELIENPDDDIDFFSIVDGEFRFCCYSLIIEMRSGVWRIVDE